MRHSFGSPKTKRLPKKNQPLTAQNPMISRIPGVQNPILFRGAFGAAEISGKPDFT